MGIFSRLKKLRQSRKAKRKEKQAAEARDKSTNNTNTEKRRGLFGRRRKKKADTQTSKKAIETTTTTPDENIQVESVSNTQSQRRNLRELLNEDGEIERQSVADFPQSTSIPFIRLYRDSLIPFDNSIGTTNDSRRAKFPQIFQDVPRYNLSKVTVLDNVDINFDFVLCLKDGKESIPDLYATKPFMDVIRREYNQGRPFAVNDIIEEKNIIVVDIKPFKEKVEVLRSKELSINLNRNEIAGQVEVRRNLFVYSNYKIGGDGVLEPSPTYDLLELIKYITWVVSKPAANYDDRLIPTDVLGDFDGYDKEEEDVPTDSPSEQTDTQTTDTGNTPPPPPSSYIPIGRKGTSAGETIFYMGKYWEWDGVEEQWIIDEGAMGRRPGIYD